MRTSAPASPPPSSPSWCTPPPATTPPHPRRSNVTITVDEGSAATAEDIFTAMLAADQFHTFAEWKRMGYSVKKGAKSAITCQLWKYTDKPGKAAREAAEAAGKDAPETDPHFYMAKAHLFHALQVEKSKR